MDVSSRAFDEIVLPTRAHVIPDTPVETWSRVVPFESVQFPDTELVAWQFDVPECDFAERPETSSPSFSWSDLIAVESIEEMVVEASEPEEPPSLPPPAPSKPEEVPLESMISNTTLSPKRPIRIHKQPDKLRRDLGAPMRAFRRKKEAIEISPSKEKERKEKKRIEKEKRRALRRKRKRVCPIEECIDVFTDKTDVLTHLKKVHAGDPHAIHYLARYDTKATKRYPCPIPQCEVGAGRREDIRKHLRLRHGIERDEAQLIFDV
jgi:hypothetical protein